ncbi:hypothetical protein [Cellulophaga baltica]|uniref:hypothetical protein n=1 Tax=Cellulophaga baltica TaxID=76594 RepID=UPI0012DD5748|nr:hypothetical protein [Cellulophaga baltica]
MKRSMLCTVMMAVFLLFSGVSCKKDTEFSETVLLPEEEVIIDVENTIVIPENFDWSNIPADYKDAVWNIQFDFDLNAATIILPEGVTLYFTGGSLSNGTVTGDGTSTIVSKTKYQVFEGIDLAGTFVEEQYLMPYWFGAVMNGITDDRDVFVETLAQAHAVTARVMVDKDIFLDVEQTGTKSIFLETDTWIEGKNDANIIINNLLSPAFYIVLSENLVFKNITLLWDNKYDASINAFADINSANLTRLKEFMTSERGVVFNSSYPMFRGPTSFYAIFSIEASSYIEYDNVKFVAKGDTADRFIPWGIKFKEQYTSDQMVTGTSGETAVSKNVLLNNVVMDGVIMGIQGIVQDFKSEGLKAYRYSDAQKLDGAYLGGYNGTLYHFPPPHLIYLNNDSSKNYTVTNVEINNTIDEGEYVGVNNVRKTGIENSGFCNSLKLVGVQYNVSVDNYKSYRRDGIADIGDLKNSVIKNLYSESRTEIFEEDVKYASLRFVGEEMENTIFENIVIKDNSAVSTFYPMDYTFGNHILWDNVNVFVNELNTDDAGFFGIFGSNNTIVNSSLSIEKHTSSQLNRGVIFHNEETLSSGANNHYEVTVNGWRTIDGDFREENCRMLFANSDNPNANYAKVIDTSNDYIIEQIDNVQQDQWTRTEVVDLGLGNSQKLDINIPAGFTVEHVSVNTLESLVSDSIVSLGTSNTFKDNLLGTISKATGIKTNLVNEVIASAGHRDVYIYSNGDFNNTGKIEVTLKLVRGSQY